MTGAMNHPPGQIIQYMIEDLGYGTHESAESDWPIYHTLLPDKPSEAIAVMDAVGILQGRSQTSGEIQEKHGIQIITRSINYNIGYNKAKDIAIGFDSIVKRTQVTVETDTYTIHTITRSTDILSLGLEEGTRRRTFSVNAFVAITMNVGTA